MKLNFPTCVNRRNINMSSLEVSLEGILIRALDVSATKTQEKMMTPDKFCARSHALKSNNLLLIFNSST